MAGRFTAQEWTKINKLLGQQSQQFGLPEGGREASLVFASFNIRKLGDAEARETELDFLARFCARCDLVAIQEVQDNLDGLRFLQHRMETHVAGDGEFGLVVSDITGEVPGERGMAERLAFLFRKRRIRQADMASDLTIDRTSVLAHFFDNEEAILTAHSVYKHQFQEFQAGRRKTRPTFAPPVFISFVRTPFVAAFEAPAANDHPPLRFTAVNAHLVCLWPTRPGWHWSTWHRTAPSTIPWNGSGTGARAKSMVANRPRRWMRSSRKSASGSGPIMQAGSSRRFDSTSVPM